MEEKHIDNVYALNEKGKEVYIENVESGQKGYFCLGCKREMQAVKSKKPNRRSYFRHVAKDVKGQKKCTYSDKAHRQKLAKEIIQKKKRIKVPALYKYPPSGIFGGVNQISEAEFIYADTVRIELPFYEDSNGEIRFGKDIEDVNKILLIQPSVTFFDANDNPILLIEFVEKHKKKISEDKLVKMKRLGIDVVQVAIPKSSPEEIGDAFDVTKHTKWLFNYEQENTEYIRVSESHSEGVSSIDEIQRKLFEESVTCRSVQIRNLIRSIKRCLESEFYRRVESGIRDEISRIEEETEKCKQQLQGIQAESESGFKIQNAKEVDRIKTEIERLGKLEDEIKSEERELDKEEKLLGKRYRKKREDLFRESERTKASINREREAIKELQEEQRELESQTRDIDHLRDELNREAEELEREERENFKRAEEQERDEIRRIHEAKEFLPKGFEEDRRTEQENFERSLIEERDRFEGFKEEQESLPKEFRRKEEELSDTFERDREELNAQFEEKDRRVYGEIEKGESGNDGDLSRDIQKYVDAISLLDNIYETRRNFRRHQIALQAIRKRAYKNWY